MKLSHYMVRWKGVFMAQLQIESPGMLHQAYQQFADHVTRKVQATPRGVVLWILH